MENVTNAVEVVETQVQTPGAITGNAKVERKFIRVTDDDFIKFLMACRTNGMSQAKMKREYASRFGGAEGSAIQKYNNLIKAYDEAIKSYEKKEKTTTIENTLVNLKRAKGYIQLKDGRGERAVTEEDKTAKLLSLLDFEDVGGEETPEVPTTGLTEAV